MCRALRALSICTSFAYAHSVMDSSTPGALHPFAQDDTPPV